MNSRYVCIYIYVRDELKYVFTCYKKYFVAQACIELKLFHNIIEYIEESMSACLEHPDWFT